MARRITISALPDEDCEEKKKLKRFLDDNNWYYTEETDVSF